MLESAAHMSRANEPKATASPPWRPAEAPTLATLIERRAEKDPDGLYFTLFGTPLTAARLHATSLRYAGALRERGLGPGDKVAIILPTCEEFFFTFFGALALGAVPVPLYPTLSPELKARVLRSAEARAVVTIDWFRADVETARAEAPDVRHLLTPDVLETATAVAAPIRAAEDSVCFLQYTSGSTSVPRGVVLSHRNVMWTVRMMVEAVGVTPTDWLVSWLPLYHDMGLIGLAFGALYTGARLALLPPDLRDPRPWLEAITEHRAQLTVSPDFGYRNCVRHVHDTTGLDLSSLRMALSGAEPVRLSTIRAFQERFGVGDIFAPAYGLAEATLAVAVWSHGQPVRVDPTGSFVSVGRPCRGVRVEVAAPDGSGRASPGEVGEILVQSPGVMQGYYRDPDATARVLRDGWLHTGDLGYLDADGYLFITGRMKDMIIVRGQNVVPSDIEEAADHVPGIRYSAAVGIESERTGTQRLHVVAEVRGDGLTSEELSRIAHDVAQAVRRRSGLRPARVLLVQPQTIPKTSSGKIQRASLAAMIAEGRVASRILHHTGAAGHDPDAAGDGR
jgi:acyl-CoA synthetase (AMP-forming)/AMP-acid ligase II